MTVIQGKTTRTSKGGKVQHLYDYAMMLGVQIEYADLERLGRAGEFDLATHTIRLQAGMVYRKERSVLAHELAHATYGDQPSIFPRAHMRQERRADEWAARFLIAPDEYRYAEAKYGANTEWIARELGVLERLVLAYERSLQRIGDTVYIHPRMGHGQYVQKMAAS